MIISIMAMGKAVRQVVEAVAVAFPLCFLSLDEVGNYNDQYVMCTTHRTNIWVVSQITQSFAHTLYANLTKS